MTTSNYQRVVKELCELVGFKDHGLLVNGGKLRIQDYRVSFIYNQAYDPKNMLVYVDMGVPSGDLEQTYKTMLKINFQLGIGERGVISLHPETGHLFYSFGFELDDEALGRSLLDTLIRFVGDVGIEALRLPGDDNAAKQAGGVAGRNRAARLWNDPA
ncbi:hypothetical protein [Collimonas sp.]|jgi:hypothetical protein|uniref:hypothetical protein n=1 Tax=Collimonas sp. TaxID=1963772 RepID=UPI002D18761D|nr:hypothetical protein [Collimonas sp.]HWW08247.1 hypothetical protein [Collimonas sp.]